MRPRIVLLGTFLLSVAVGRASWGAAQGWPVPGASPRGQEGRASSVEGAAPSTAVLAGGCFWCVESDLEKVAGVVAVESGYTGGRVANPGYQAVSAGGTGHYEAVRVTFDSDKISYERLLDVFWRNIDPTDSTGQFCDKGPQYKAAIFHLDDVQKKLAVESKQKVEKAKPFTQAVGTEILPAGPFFPAEEYHQDYYKKNPVRYKLYRTACGRDRRLKELWGSSAGGH